MSSGLRVETFSFATTSNETDVLQEWLREAGELAEKNAVAEWDLIANPKGINIPDFALSKCENLSVITILL